MAQIKDLNLYERTQYELNVARAILGMNNELGVELSPELAMVMAKSGVAAAITHCERQSAESFDFFSKQNKR